MTQPLAYHQGVLHALERDVESRTGRYRWVYLWHWPVRIAHWTTVLSVALLLLTGFYMGRPYFLGPAQLGAPYFLQWVRLVHFAAAGALVAAAILRVYLLLSGNRFERFAALFPVRRRDRANMWHQLRCYLTVNTDSCPRYLGHNPLQQLMYTLVYLAGVVMVATGFALYAQAEPGGLLFRAFAWVPALLGGLGPVRLVHHVVSWFFLIFIPIHVYVALRNDVLERNGLLSSMVSGGRFFPAGERYEDE